MKIKKLFILIIIFLLFLFLLIVFKKDHNWQFFVEKNIGSKSILQENNNLFFGEDFLFFSDQEENIYALNKNNGEKKWIFVGQNYSPFEINIINNEVYFASFDAHIYRLDRKNGYPVWSFAIPEQIISDTEVIADENDQAVFFADRAGALYALDKNNGRVIWTKQFESLDNRKSFIKNSIHFGFIHQDEDFLYVRNFPQQKFVILKKSNGEEVFKIEDFVPNTIDLTIFEDILIILKSPTEYMAVDKNNYDIKWSIKGGSTNYPPKMFSDEYDEEAVLFLDNQIVHKIDKNNGERKWTQKIISGSKIHTINSLLDLILLENKDHLKFDANLKGLSWHDGEVKWEISIPSAIQDLLIKDKYIFVSTITNDLLIIDTETNQIIKRLKTQGLVLKILSFDEKIVLVAADPGKKALVYSLDADKKEFDWEYKSDMTIHPNEVYKDNDRLYYLNEEKYLIESIRIGSKAPKPKLINKTNFKFTEDFSKDNPRFKENPKAEYEKKKEGILNIIKEFWQRNLYRFNNFFNLFKFELEQNQLNEQEYEIVIKHDQNLYNNFFTDVEIKGVFTNKSNEKISIKGFYYDYNTWKIRFVNNKDSVWEWQAEITTSFYKAHKSGKIITKPGNLSKKITIKDDNFVINDKEIFFPIGMQDSIIDRNYNGNPFDQMGFAKGLQPVIKEEDFEFVSFREYLDLYKNESCMNIFRVGIDNWGPSLLRNLELSNFTININDAKFVDFMLEELRARDYKIIMTIFGFYPPYQNSEEFRNKQKREAVAKYLDYVIARYAPYIDIWEISNEASIPIEWTNFISDYITNNDQYGSLITTNWEQKQLRNSELISIHWYSPITEDNFSLEEQFDYLEKKHSGWEKAILISELGFKDFSYFEDSSEMMRKQVWLSVFKKMGVIFWNQPFGVYENKDNANIYLGPKEREYLNNLYKYLPKMEIPVKKKQIIYDKEKIHLYLLENKQYLLGYLLNQKNKSQRNLPVDLKISKNGYLEWFDPKTGFIIKSLDVKQGSVKIVIPNISADLAFRIKYH